MEEKLYDKTVKCPVCETTTKIKYPKKGTYRISKKDSDLMVYYEGVNPLFYGVEFCAECGYAALSPYFGKIRSSQVDKIRNGVCMKYNKVNYPPEYTVDTAIQQHKLALLNAIVKEGYDSEKAIICLRLSWFYRLKGDAENERRFQEQAVGSFEKAYMIERLPVAGYDRHTILYTIGELFRRLGDYDKATTYFGQVLSSLDTPPKLKDMIRDARELMKQENND